MIDTRNPERRAGKTGESTGDYYDSWSFAVGFATGIVLAGVALIIGFWFI